MNLPIKTGHLFIGAAIILGLVTMILFGTMGKPSKSTTQKAVIETQPVVVPVIPILKGETLTGEKLKVVKWPKEYLPQGSTYQTVIPLLGRVPLQDLMPGEPIFSQKLSSPDTDGLPALIPAGYRALSIGVSETKGVAGFIKPGDRVDVLCTFSLSGTRSDGSRNKYYRTVTLAQDVLVLASAQTMVEDKKYDIETPEGVSKGEVSVKNNKDSKEEKDTAASKNRRKKDETPEKKSAQDLEKEKKAALKAKSDAEKKAKLVSSVTIAVNPEQAQQITLAEGAGDLRLVLRSASDIKKEAITATESEDVVYPAGTKKPEPPPPPPPPPMPPQAYTPAPPPGPSVEVIEGTQKTSVQF